MLLKAIISMEERQTDLFISYQHLIWMEDREYSHSSKVETQEKILTQYLDTLFNISIQA